MSSLSLIKTVNASLSFRADTGSSHITQHHQPTQTRNELCRVSCCGWARTVIQLLTQWYNYLLSDTITNSVIQLLTQWYNYLLSPATVPTIQVPTCPVLPILPPHHRSVWIKFGLSVQSWLFTEGGKVRTQEGMNRINWKWIVIL